MQLHQACRLLGVPSSSSFDSKELKRAYRREALRWHPDKNGGSLKAKERFQEIGAAYEFLSNLSNYPHTSGGYPTNHRAPNGGYAGGNRGFTFAQAEAYFEEVFGVSLEEALRKAGEGAKVVAESVKEKAPHVIGAASAVAGIIGEEIHRHAPQIKEAAERLGEEVASLALSNMFCHAACEAEGAMEVAKDEAHILERRVAWQEEQLDLKRAKSQVEERERQQRAEIHRKAAEADLITRASRRRHLAAQRARGVAQRTQKLGVVLGQLIVRTASVALSTLAAWFFGMAWLCVVWCLFPEMHILPLREAAFALAAWFAALRSELSGREADREARLKDEEWARGQEELQRHHDEQERRQDRQELQTLQMAMNETRCRLRKCREDADRETKKAREARRRMIEAKENGLTFQSATALGAEAVGMLWDRWWK